MLDIKNIQLNGSAKEFNYSEAYNNCRVDLSKELERPPTALGIGYTNSFLNSTFTYGEMSAIVAPQKSKKTFFKIALESCYIGGGASYYFPSIISKRDSDKFVLSFDTEQGDFYAQRSFKSVERMVNTQYDNYHCFKMKGMSDDDMMEFIEACVNDPKYKGNIGWITIDGVADLCTNTNDIVKSKDIIKRLEAITKQGIHVCGVIHKTFEKDRATGHLGGYVQKKSETVIFLSDTDQDTINAPIKVHQKDSRGAPFQDFYFDLDQETILPKECEQAKW